MGGSPLGWPLAVAALAAGAACQRTESLGTFKVEMRKPAAASVAGPSAVVALPGAPIGFADVKKFFTDHCDRCHSDHPEAEVPPKTAAKARTVVDSSRYPFGGKLGERAPLHIRKVLAIDPRTGRRAMPLDDPTLPTEGEVARVTAWLDGGARP